ncbi:hypothetical protein C0J52_15419 [Blattella germanica]|nr:hypothetical protein C0J52_15419 [Blattella germanica]
MVRTKADSSSVKVSVKAPRKVAVAPTTTVSDAKKDYSGGNPYCPRETPPWQKSITHFFKTTPNDGGNTSEEKTKMDVDLQEAPGTS